MTLIETEDGVQRMTARATFNSFERDTVVIALSRAQMRESGFGVLLWCPKPRSLLSGRPGVMRG